MLVALSGSINMVNNDTMSEHSIFISRCIVANLL